MELGKIQKVEKSPAKTRARTVTSPLLNDLIVQIIMFIAENEKMQRSKAVTSHP